jgi:hypothetical protein
VAQLGEGASHRHRRPGDPRRVDVDFHVDDDGGFVRPDRIASEPTLTRRGLLVVEAPRETLVEARGVAYVRRVR